MAKINRLLEKRLELADYEKAYGDLPSALKNTQSIEGEEGGSESDYQSSSDDQLDGSLEPVK